MRLGGFIFEAGHGARRAARCGEVSEILRNTPRPGGDRPRMSNSAGTRTPSLTSPYATALECFFDYQRLTRAALLELIQVANTEGWANCIVSPSMATVVEIKTMITSRLAATSTQRSIVPALAAAKRLGLTSAALDALWLLAHIDSDPACAALVAALHPAGVAECSVAVLQRLLGTCSGTQLTSQELAHLDTFALIEVAEAAGLSEARRGIRVPDRVLDLLRGELSLEARSACIATLQFANPFSASVPPPAAMRAAFTSEPAPVIVAYGPRGSGRSETLLALAARRNLPTLRIRCAALPPLAGPLRKALRELLRECLILEATPLFENIDDVVDATLQQELGPALAQFRGIVFATARALGTAGLGDGEKPRPIVEFEITLPDEIKRIELWQTALPSADAALIAQCAARYNITPAVIASVGRAVQAQLNDDANAAGFAHVRDAMRSLFDRTLAGMATRIEVAQTWDDLVLPAEQLEKIAELVSRRQHRQQVLEDWGFAAKIGKGFGIAALFSGPPGTGKTMVAGLIARELQLDLYQVDLSKLVSKYIGETEKQLATLFDAAETGHAIILFDEADSLFGKRSEVKSSNDRYANMAVNYLLQRLEVFAGIALLTTNHENAIDEAFRRRLAIHVRFAAPDQTARAALWSAMLPQRAAVAGDVAPLLLARKFDLSGGYIKNAVVRAAFLAAGDNAAISMSYIERAAEAECEAMGRVVRRE